CFVRDQSEEREAHLEQFFNIPNAGFVDQEQNDVVIRLDPQVIVGHQHLVVADDGTDGGARRQIDFIQPFANHFGGPVIAVGDGFDGFGSAAAQGVYVHHVAPAYVGQQAADGGLLG